MSWRYRRQSHTPGDLTLPLGPNRTPTPIPRLKASEACEFLGAMTRPNGNQSNQFQFLLSKAKKWADAIRTKHISKHDGWYCLNNTILKILEYPLMATTLSRKQCKDLMKPILKAGLQKSQVQCNMPRAIVHGSLAVQGFDLHHLHSTQTIQHLQALMRHGTRTTVTSQLLQATMQGLQLELGFCQHLFGTLDFPSWNFLATHSWISNTWETIFESSLDFCGPPIAPTPPRTGDIGLMDFLMEQPLSIKVLVPPQQLLAFDQKFSGLRTLPQWTEHKSMLTPGKANPVDRPDAHDWPKTFHPSDQDLNKWQAAPQPSPSTLDHRPHCCCITLAHGPNAS